MYSPVSNRRGVGIIGGGGVEKISRINSQGVGIVGGLEEYLESNSRWVVHYNAQYNTQL